MNTCPVYRRSGGLSYGATYSGPIGVIIDPTFNLRKYSNLPFASTLNGSCTNVCPVKINIHEQIYKWRQVIVERGQLPFVKKQAMQAAGKVLASPKLYRAAVEGVGAAIEHLPRVHGVIAFQRLGPTARRTGRAAADLPPVVSEEPGESMSSREDDSGAVRRNQPAPRPLPDVPLFDADLPPALERVQGGACSAWGARSPSCPAAPTSMRSCASAFRMPG